MSKEKDPQQAIEDEFFGEPDVLKISKQADQPSAALHEMRSNTADRAHEAADTNTPEHVIDRLQSEGKLPESIYAPQLAKFLEFLGRRLGVRIDIKGEASMFPQNQRALNLETSNLALFLKRGALASTFLMPLVLSSQAIAQELQPGMELVQTGAAKVINSGHHMFHWENLLALLLLLGVSGFVAMKLFKKFKKSDQEKAAYQGFDDYEKAKESGDRDAEKKAKETILAGTMSEMPADIEDVAETIEITSKDELKEAFKFKKWVDEAIQLATHKLESAMVLPEEKSLPVLDELKDKVLKIFDQQLSQLEALYIQLAEEWAKAPENSYLRQQLEYEKKKLKYFMDYLKLMRKKWLIVIQNAKNELVFAANKDDLSAEDQHAKEIHDLKEELTMTLDAQSNLDPNDFQTRISDLDEAISRKAKPTKAPEETEVGWDKIALHDNGDYNHTTGINYAINGQEFHVDLNKDFSVQIWINDDKKIQMNFNHKRVLIDFLPLIVVTANGFAIKETGQLLETYITEKQKDDTVKATEASAELTPEAEPVLSELAQKVINVSKQINDNSYNTFGERVEADDEAIKYHLLRVHREFYEGKAKTVVRFCLEEGYWKKALSELNQQNDVPKSSVNFNFENSAGEKMNINQPMRRFNVLVGGKQATVLITQGEQYKALAGEARVIFNPKDNFTEEEIKKAFAEVSKKLGLNDHIKPVTPAAKDRLRKKLQKIRKESSSPAGSTVAVHNEYSAETVENASVETLKKHGLHSMYHQFDLDITGPLFKAGNLMCTTTRWSKGVLKSGMSSTTDLGNGGATEVFMRCHTNQSASQSTWYNSKPAVVFSPELLTRLDCYCHSSDKYGSKLPGVFDERISPAQLLKQLSQVYQSNHEVMMYDAVDLKDAEYIVYSNPQEVIYRLKQAGITNIGGKPLEKAVITPDQFRKIKI